MQNATVQNDDTKQCRVHRAQIHGHMVQEEIVFCSFEAKSILEAVKRDEVNQIQYVLGLESIRRLETSNNSWSFLI